MMMMIVLGFCSLEEEGSVPLLFKCLQIMGLTLPFFLLFLLDIACYKTIGASATLPENSIRRRLVNSVYVAFRSFHHEYHAGYTASDLYA